MASVLQGEKQLFDKFWRGTFKALATPRPESVIIASIAARREANRLETSVCVATKPSDTKSAREEQEVKEAEKKRHRKHRERKRHSRRHCHSVSLDADFSPRPGAKAKKKKKKSVRKRRRERCHTSSPSPLRKKKKKKKKSSKKRKQHRTAPKKRRHSSSSTRRKRKEDRKHKKRCCSDSHHRRRSRRVDSSDWRSSSTESRCEDSSKSDFQRSSRGSGERGGFEWGSAVKLATKIPSKCTVVHSRPGLETAIVQDSPCIQGKGRADYDSGNDTSSPPSSKTGVSRVQVIADRQEKLKFMDNSSDSGNSLSSYRSLSKAEHRARHINTSVFSKLKSEEESSSCVGFMSHHSPSAVKYQYRSETRSRSRSRSSRSSRHWGRYISRSRSPSSSRRSYSRSSSYSCDSRRGSVCSVSSRRSGKTKRIRERRRSSSSCEKPSKRSRKRSRRRSSSPMRKRRRDSPSHLEARRITSARKRPIPYYRPSPSSSSSRSSSLSSWSLFSLIRSQSRSPIHGRSRSRSRSPYRSYSRSTSLSSIYSSRSYDSLSIYSRSPLIYRKLYVSESLEDRDVWPP